MSLKKLLAIPLLISLAFFVYFSAAVSNSFSRLLSAIDFTPAFVSMLVAAVALQLIGHWIRAKKTALLLGKVKESSVRFQFRGSPDLDWAALRRNYVSEFAATAASEWRPAWDLA